MEIYKTIRHLVLNHLLKLPGFNLLPLLVNHPKIYNFEWKQGQTPASSPLFLTLVVVSYISFAVVVPRTTAYPSSFTISRRLLKNISLVHNLILLTVSLLMAVGGALSIVFLSPDWDSVVCFPINTQPKGPLFLWAYVFYLSKMYEFMDTLLIIFGNSKRRLTFLHIYHHSTVVVMCYISLNTAQSMFPGVLMINAIVHVIMYFYYFLCTVGIRPTWKKFVTDCQIWQFFSSFAIMALIFYYHFTGPGCSGIVGWCFDAVYIASLLVMFLDFHAKNYSKGYLKAKLK